MTAPKKIERLWVGTIRTIVPEVTFVPPPSAALSAAGTDRRTRVLVLIPTLEVGGAEMDLVRNLPRLDRARFTVVVCSFVALGTLASQLIDAGVEVIGPDEGGRSGSVSFDGIFRRLGRSRNILDVLLDATPSGLASRLKYLDLSRPIARLIREGSFDVVHTILPSAYFIGVLANVLTRRRPLVMSRVSLNWYQRNFRLLGWIERHVLHRRVDLAIGNCGAILQELHAEGVPERKLMLVHNGIDASAFATSMIDRSQARDRLGVPEGALVFSSVANLHPYKGHADILNALHLAGDRLPENWVLLVAGQDVEGNLAVLNRLSGELGLFGHVRFLRRRLDVPLILSAADIHVSASHHEGFPNNILEAMSAGLPVVATAVGGVPEQVVDGVTGLLVPPRQPKALAEALHALAADPGRRANMGLAARERVERHFSIDQSVAAIEQAYSRVARPCGKQRP